MIKLYVLRFGMPYESLHQSIEDAAYMGCLEIEDNTASPTKITDGNKIVWESYPEDSYKKLKQLAKFDED